MGKIVRRVQATIVSSKVQIVFKLSLENAIKRAKCVRCAIGLPGVLSVLASHEDNKITVVGEEIDSVKLLKLLREKMGYVELVWVKMVEEKKENEMKVEAEGKSNIQPVTSPYYYGQYVSAITQPPYYYNGQDRLLLWRLYHTQKDGSLSSQEAKQKWKLACQILAKKGLIPEDGNVEENERVFEAVMESEHPNRMLYKDFGAESSNNKAELARMAEEMSEQSKEILSLKNAINQLVALMQQQCQVSQACLPSTTDANVRDRLLLWRLNHTKKDGSLSSQEAKQKWKLACQILAKKGLIPEDGNVEENERVFEAVMESEHPNRILYKDFGAESSNNKAEIARMAEEMSEQSKETLSHKGGNVEENERIFEYIFMFLFFLVLPLFVI